MSTFITQGFFSNFVLAVVFAFLALVAFEILQKMWRRVGRRLESSEWNGKNGGVPIPMRPLPPPPSLKPDRSRTVGTGTISWTFVIPGGKTTDLSSFVDPPTHGYGGHDVAAP